MRLVEIPSDALKAESVRVTVKFKDVLILTPRAGVSMLQSIGDTLSMSTVIIFVKPMEMTSGRMDNPRWKNVIRNDNDKQVH